MDIKYCIFNGEVCEVKRIVNANACIVTGKGIRFIHISKLQPADVQDQTNEADIDLADMTKAELIAYAERRNITVDKRDKKADIINAIENASA